MKLHSIILHFGRLVAGVSAIMVLWICYTMFLSGGLVLLTEPSELVLGLETLIMSFGVFSIGYIVGTIPDGAGNQ